jgi:hypothetical protein
MAWGDPGPKAMPALQFKWPGGGNFPECIENCIPLLEMEAQGVIQGPRPHYRVLTWALSVAIIRVRPRETGTLWISGQVTGSGLDSGAPVAQLDRAADF